jgi:hypothetical protein
VPETGGPEPIIYRTEVLGILGALADLVVDVRAIRGIWKAMKRKRSKKEISEQAVREAENMPSVRLLRELAAKGWADLEARRMAEEAAKARES